LNDYKELWENFENGPAPDTTSRLSQKLANLPSKPARPYPKKTDDEEQQKLKLGTLIEFHVNGARVEGELISINANDEYPHKVKAAGKMHNMRLTMKERRLSDQYGNNIHFNLLSYSKKMRPQLRQESEMSEEEKEEILKGGRAVHDWLRSMGMESKGDIFWQQGYRSMRMIQQLKKGQIEKMFAVTECDENATETIIASLDGLPSCDGSIKIKYKHGVEVLSEPVYGGEPTNFRLERGEMARYLEAKKTNYMGYGITFYKLADGRGWTHNFIPAYSGNIIEEVDMGKPHQS